MAIKIQNSTIIDDSRNIINAGVVTAQSFVGNLTGTATTATFLSDAANITTGTISTDRLSGTYNINITGVAGEVTYTTYADIAGISTFAGISTNVIGGIASVTNLTVSGVSTFNSSVGIGTTNSTAALYVVGDSYITGILTANRIFSNVYGEFTGGGISGTNIVGTALSISGISTLGITSVTHLDAQSINSSGIITGSTFRPSTGYIQSPNGTNSFYIYDGTGNVAFQGTIGASQINNASGNKIIGFAGTNNATFENHVYIAGITTSVGGFVGNLTGTATTATNLADAANITTGTINSARLTGTYGISVTGSASTASFATTAYNLTDAANITAGTINASRLSGTYTISISGNAATANYASTAGIATYATNAGVSTNVIGGIASVTNLTVSGVSTFNSSVGIGTTNPTSALYVVGDSYITGILTANRIVSSVYGEFTGGGISGTNIVGTALSISGISTLGVTSVSQLYVSGVTTSMGGFVGNLTGTASTASFATTAFNLTDAANITAGTISTARLTGTYNIDINGNATTAIDANFAGYATNAGVATYASTAGVATALQNSRTFEITGDIIASPISFNGTGNVSLAATIQPNSVGLGTDTTGNYVQSITGTANEIEVTGGSGEGSTPQIGLPNDIIIANNLSVGGVTTSTGGFVGNLTGTASTSSFATTAFNLTDAANITTGTINSARLAGTYNIDISGNASTATYATNAGIATYATNAGVATYATNAGVATYATNAGIATYADVAGIATYADVATYATNAGVATYATNAGVATYATNAGIATYATNAGIATYADVAGIATYADVAGIAGIATYATNAGIATYATNAGIATYADVTGIAGIATYATNAGVATYAVNAGVATYADVAGIATYATNAGVATYADVAGIATYATNAGIATYAVNAGVATYAVNAGVATYAINAGVATYATSSGIATYASVAGVATALQNTRTFEIIGDIIASPISFDGTGNVSLAATIQPNSVGLGTDTFGDYVKDITGTANQITVTSGTGEGSTPVLSIPSQFTVPQDLTVLRDVQIDRNLNVNGNITIGGTTAFINVQQLRVSDPDLVLGFRTDINGNDSSNDNTANHGGIAVASTEGNPLVQLFIAGIETTPATYKKIMWFKAGEFAGLGTDAWLMNYAVGVGSTQFPTGTRLAAGSVQLTENDIAAVRNINASGIVTASGGFVGSLTGTASTASFATTAFNLENAANITTGTINSARLTGTYNIDISGNAATSTYAVNAGIATYAVNAGISTYADVAGIATYATNAGVATYADVAGIATYATNAGVSTNVIGGIASVANLTVSGVSTFSDTVYVGSGITFYASSGIVSATAFYGNGENLSDIIKAKLSGITLYEDGVQVGTPYQYSEINVVGNYVTATGIGSTATITFTTPPYADVAGIATYATNAGIATYADVAGIATYATNAGVSTYAETAGIATSVINNPGVGVATAGGTVGTGATILDFRGPGISTITVSAGIATISIENLTQIDKQSFEVGAGGTSIFNLNQSYDSGYIDVYINGVRLSTSSFTETSPTVITLTEPANPGDVVEFQSFKQLVNTSSLWNNSFNGIYTNDNVGIGLTDPSAKLEINGTTKIKGFVETQSSSTISNNILNLNANNGTVFSHTTTENIGIVSFTGISTSGASNQTFTVLVTQGATPYNTTAATGIGTQLATIVTSDGVGYSTHIKVGGGTTITLTNSAGALDVLTFIVSYNGNVSVSNTSFTVIGFAATDFRGVI